MRQSFTPHARTVWGPQSLMSCTDQLANSPSGFDRSATLARAADAKRAEGPAHL